MQAQGNEADASKREAAPWFSAGITDGSGMLSVERGASGYGLFAAKGNARSAVVGVAPHEDEVTLELAQEANLRLLLVDGDGVPICDLPLELRVQRTAAAPGAPVFTFAAASNDQGRVEARLPKGQYLLTFPSWEWCPMDQADHGVRVGANVVERTIALRRIPAIHVRAIDANTGTEIREFAGSIVPKDQSLGRVVVRQWWPHKQATEHHLRVPCLLPMPESFKGSLVLVIKADGYPTACRELGGFPENEELTVELEPAEPLRLRFLDDQGRPYPGLLARLRYMGSQEQAGLRPDDKGEKGNSDSEGLLELTGWEDGIWSVQPSFMDGTFFHAARLVLPEDGLSHEIRLPRPGWIEGEILGAEADEYPGVVAVDTSGTRIAATIRNGRYRVADLAPGTYWMTVDEALHHLSYCLYFKIDVGTRVIVEPGRATVLDFELDTMGAWQLEGAIMGLDNRQHWVAVVPVVTGRLFFLRPENLIPLAADGSFVLRTGCLRAATAMLCVVSEDESGVLLPTLCKEISTEERYVVLRWAPGRLRVVDNAYETCGIERLTDRLFWQESGVPTGVDLTLAPGRYRISSRQVVDVSPGRVSRAVMK